MSSELNIRVHYHDPEREIRLRTQHDWTRSLAPATVDRDAGRSEFQVALDRPYLYFKPVLDRPADLRWSLGENYLALANGKPELDVYPAFFATGGCSACRLHYIRSSRTGREHAVRVFYPPGYTENTLERFPVVYMQDGQNLFFPDQAFSGHDWKIRETLSVLDAMNLVRRVIVVGVYPKDRMVDYTLDGYQAYGEFVVDDLKPWVDATYRTLDGPQNTAVIGSSLGGVVSLHLAWRWPEVFGNAGCLSSTFGYRDDLVERVANDPARPIRIYLDSGWPGDNYEATRNMFNVLTQRGYALGKDLLYLAFPRAAHDERAWSMRAHIPFQHFFRS